MKSFIFRVSGRFALWLHIIYARHFLVRDTWTTRVARNRLPSLVPTRTPWTSSEVHDEIDERIRAWLREQGVTAAA